MKIEVGQYWRLNNNSSTYYVYEVMAWMGPSVGWGIEESSQGRQHVAAELRRCGEPDPDYMAYWKEHKDVLLENYHLITDQDEIGWLSLQES